MEEVAWKDNMKKKKIKDESRVEGTLLHWCTEGIVVHDGGDIIFIPTERIHEIRSTDEIILSPRHTQWLERWFKGRWVRIILKR